MWRVTGFPLYNGPVSGSWTMPRSYKSQPSACHSTAEQQWNWEWASCWRQGKLVVRSWTRWFPASALVGWRTPGRSRNTAFIFLLWVNLMAAFIKFFTALNLKALSTYFFLIQHSEHIQVLLQISPCPKVKKKKKKCSICYSTVSVIRHTKNLRKHKHHPSVLYCNSGKENYIKPRKAKN